jgi:Fe-S oxidoreductase
MSNIPQKEQDLLESKKLRIYVITWNMNGRLPINNLDALLGNPKAPIADKKYSSCHLVAICTQECENSIEKSVLFSSSKQGWEKLLDNHFGANFEQVKIDSLVAMHIAVYVRKEFRNYINRTILLTLNRYPRSLRQESET